MAAGKAYNLNRTSCFEFHDTAVPHLYHLGTTIFAEATRWAEKAADQGHGNAQRLLAVLADLNRITEETP